MTALLHIAYRVRSSNSADALTLAKERARKDGYAIKGVKRVDFVGPAEWSVGLTVAKKEAPVG